MTSAASVILVVDDDATACWSLRQVLTHGGFAVSVASEAASARRLALRHRPSLIITDLCMPGQSGLELIAALRRDLPGVPVVLTTAYGSLDVAVRAQELGAYGFLPKPLDLEAILGLARRACGHQPLAIQAVPGDTAPELAGSSPAMQTIFQRIAVASVSDIPVLLHGPTGTGKEVVARSIHRYSGRKDGPFVAVNCAAIPPALVESELFGHVEGAFTGAGKACVGRCQSASGGVLFLDEIGDLPRDAQTALMRFLDHHTVAPVGGMQEVPVDVRVIAASNRTLIGPGATLREDLFFRLRGLTIELPSLADRAGDIPEVVTALLKRIANQVGRRLSVTEDALQAICQQHWPGNARQLKHQLEEAAVLAPGGIIAPEHLRPPPPEPAKDFRQAITRLTGSLMHSDPGRVHERALMLLRPLLVRQVLQTTGGNYLQAADLLGVNRITLKRWAVEDGCAEETDSGWP